MNSADLHEARKAGLPTRLRAYWEEAEFEQMQPLYEGPTFQADEWGILDIVKIPLCGGFDQKYSTLPGKACKWPAGHLTTHLGTGKCFYHNGYFGRELRKGAIFMALAYADEMNVSPWEALLSQCRLLSNQVAWLRIRVYEVEKTYGAPGLRPGGEGWDWVAMLEARGDRLAKVAKMCLDAGIQQQLVASIELEADHMMKAALAGMDAAGLEGPARERMLDGMSAKLLELTSGIGDQA